MCYFTCKLFKPALTFSHSLLSQAAVTTNGSARFTKPWSPSRSRLSSQALLQTVVNVTSFFAKSGVSLDLPSYRQVAVAVARRIDDDPADVLLRLSASLIESHPHFDDWDSFFGPVVVEMAKSENGNIVEEITTLLSRAREEHDYALSVDDATALLETARRRSNGDDDATTELAFVLRNAFDDVALRRRSDKLHKASQDVDDLVSALAASAFDVDDGDDDRNRARDHRRRWFVYCRNDDDGVWSLGPCGDRPLAAGFWRRRRTRIRSLRTSPWAE